jgi:hypothetical protein
MSVVIKNISDEPYSIEELGGVSLPSGENLDLMDGALPSFYNNWWAANYLVTVENPSKLWADIQAGKIELVSSTEPERPELPGMGP